MAHGLDVLGMAGTMILGAACLSISPCPRDARGMAMALSRTTVQRLLGFYSAWAGDGEA